MLELLKQLRARRIHPIFDSYRYKEDPSGIPIAYRPGTDEEKWHMDESVLLPAG